MKPAITTAAAASDYFCLDPKREKEDRVSLEGDCEAVGNCSPERATPNKHVRSQTAKANDAELNIPSVD